MMRDSGRGRGIEECSRIVVGEVRLRDGGASAVKDNGLRNPISYVISEGRMIGDVCFSVRYCRECGRCTGVELPFFDAGQVPIVCEGDKFLGLITRIDLLNYLRRRMQ